MADQTPDPGQKDPQQHDQDSRPNILQVIWSVIAAVFGVQSDQNRERDFRKGDARDYIAVYVILVIALVIGMIVVVNTILDAAGK